MCRDMLSRTVFQVTVVEAKMKVDVMNGIVKYTRNL